MRKIILLLTIILIGFVAKSQDTVRIKHINYTTVFSKSKKYPVLVEWWVTKAKVSCPTPLKRKDNFQPDPQLKKETDLLLDYKGSGFDRGHMMPAADNLCQTPEVQNQCFYFSNMSAQYHSLNAGDWKVVEMWTRDMSQQFDSIHVWCGNIGESKKIGTVSVPKTCWKVVYIKKTNEWFSFLFENVNIKQTGMKSHEIPKSEMERVTGFNFN